MSAKTAAAPRQPSSPWASSRIAFACALAFLGAFTARAQDKPNFTIKRDCGQFAISADNKIVCSVTHLKRYKKLFVQRDDIWVAAASGKEKQIVDDEKFMPVPPPSNYTVNGFAWSTDSQRLAVSMTTEHPSTEDEPAAATKVVALLDEEGHEIKMPGLKTRFIENATNGTWLADNASIVYLTGIGPYQIVRARPSDGQTVTLFAGHSFDAVIWDAKNNQAFAIGQNLTVSGRQALVLLDLLHETIREISRVEMYQGEMVVSPSGKKIAFFVDGDTLEVHDLASPAKTIRVKAGFGRFQWGPDEKRVLLKRGPADKSNDLVWVDLYDGTFVPALHDLEYHSFAISPDSQTIVVTEPGKGVLKVYPLVE